MIRWKQFFREIRLIDAFSDFLRREGADRIISILID